MWMIPLHLHVNQKSDYEYDDNMKTKKIPIFKPQKNDLILRMYENIRVPPWGGDPPDPIRACYLSPLIHGFTDLGLLVRTLLINLVLTLIKTYHFTSSTHLRIILAST